MTDLEWIEQVLKPWNDETKASIRQKLTTERLRGQIQAVGDFHVTLQMNPEITGEDLLKMAQKRIGELQVELKEKHEL